MNFSKLVGAGARPSDLELRTGGVFKTRQQLLIIRFKKWHSICNGVDNRIAAIICVPVSDIFLFPWFLEKLCCRATVLLAPVHRGGFGESGLASTGISSRPASRPQHWHWRCFAIISIISNPMITNDHSQEPYHAALPFFCGRVAEITWMPCGKHVAIGATFPILE